MNQDEHERLHTAIKYLEHLPSSLIQDPELLALLLPPPDPATVIAGALTILTELR